MALFMCFWRPGTINTFLCKQVRVSVVPSMKRNILSNKSLNKSFLESPRMNPFYSPAQSISTTMVRRHDETPHDHAKIWIVEKATTASLVVLIPFGLLIPNKLFDTILAILITAHSYWGLEACVVEYVRVLLFGPQLPKIAMGVVYGITAFMLGGLMFLNFNDIGMCRGFWKIWRNMKRPADGSRQPGGKGGNCN